MTRRYVFWAQAVSPDEWQTDSDACHTNSEGKAQATFQLITLYHIYFKNAFTQFTHA